MPFIFTSFIEMVLTLAVAMGLGFCWYSPILFGKAWQKAVGLSDKQLKKVSMHTSFCAMVIGILLLTWSIQYLFGTILVTSLSDHILLAVALWLGLAMGPALGHHAFAQKPASLFIIDQGYSLVMVIIATVIVYKI
jgi:hypothetical protein